MSNIIDMNNITKKYGSITAVENVSLHIKKGNMTAITGRSGSGKTTLLNIMGLISRPTSGEYKLDGDAVNNINSRRSVMMRRYKIGYLFQNYGLVEDETVEWNVRLAYAYKKKSKKERNVEIDCALERYHLHNVRHKKVYTLSGGEQQRVAMAGLMIKDSDLILADEPTGSLDPENRDIVLDSLNEFNRKGKTVIVVTHDPVVASSCSSVIELQ